MRNGDAGRESPVHAGGADFFGSDARGFLDEVGIAGAAEADVLREASGADDVVVAVDRVNAIDERDFQTRVCGARLITVIHVRPGDEIVAGFGIGIAAAEDGAEAVVGDVVGVLDEELVGLGHLADFFVERHLFEDGESLGVVAGENASPPAARPLRAGRRVELARAAVQVPRNDLLFIGFILRLHGRIRIALPSRTLRGVGSVDFVSPRRRRIYQ